MSNAAPALNLRKVHIAINGEAKLASGHHVALEIDFEAPCGGGYRFRVTLPDGSLKFTPFYPAIAPLETSGKLRKILTAA